MPTLLTVTGAVVLFSGLLLLLALVRGFVLSWLWLWFVTPLGLPSLSIPHAIGIALIVTYLTTTSRTTSADDESNFPEKTVTALAIPFFVLGMGWIVTFFL